VLWLLAIAPPVAMIAFGCAWFFSALGVFIRDIANIMPFFMQILMYMSAVFYPFRSCRKRRSGRKRSSWRIRCCSPSSAPGRRPVSQSPSLKKIAYIWICGASSISVGYLTFRKLRPAFADVI